MTARTSVFHVLGAYVSSNALCARGSETGSGSLDRWCYRDSPVTVFQSIYTYLRDATLAAETIITLSRLPLVPVGSRLVRPDCLFQSVQQSFPPFIVEVSSRPRLTVRGTTHPEPPVYCILLAKCRSRPLFTVDASLCFR
jgi:hypothetical protein